MELSGTRSNTDERGVSEMTAVATLVGLAVVLVLGIGINVFLFAPDAGGEPEAEFTFRHIEQTSALIITHEDGDSIPSGDLYVEGEDKSASWTALAGWEDVQPVEPGDVVQVGEGGAYGAPVGPNDRVSVIWRNESVNGSATLAQWNGDASR
ncbi:type IV pilin [Halorhabdus amylolytica]|uniref:type IV pilin n=1 Tax=Halorhabdus amylolytica TaxID=2559573 RepID=UPI0010AAE4D2|nr:type IV pilin [Halorhabdus amylolytica]